MAKKYFRTIDGTKWNFAQPTKNRQGKETLVTLPKFSYIPIVRHVKVKDTASPDDPSLTKYCQVRFLGGKDTVTYAFLLDQKTAGVDAQISLTRPQVGTGAKPENIAVLSWMEYTNSSDETS